MRLLLTSTGVTNPSLKQALIDLVGKELTDSKLVFVPTAGYDKHGDKSWLDRETQRARDLGWAEFKVVDIARVQNDELAQELHDVDVVFVNGGNPYFLMEKMQESGFKEIINDLLNKVVYVGSSAGSMVTSKYFFADSATAFGEEERVGRSHLRENLGLVDFYIKPHLNSSEFSERNMQWFERAAAKLSFPLYAIDDQTGIKVVDNNVQVVSEGQWRLFNDDK